MYIIGITGSIATGKTTLAKTFLRRGAVVFDADKQIHQLLKNKATQPILEMFPQIGEQESGKIQINRKKLGKIVFADITALQKIEAILHPMLYQEMKKFMREAYCKKYDFVILDIPLLFEKNMARYCDLVILADVPAYIQKMRLEQKRHLDLKTQKMILSQQMPLDKKRKYADIMIPMNLPFGIIKRKMIAIDARKNHYIKVKKTRRLAFL